MPAGSLRSWSRPSASAGHPSSGYLGPIRQERKLLRPWAAPECRIDRGARPTDRTLGLTAVGLSAKLLAVGRSERYLGQMSKFQTRILTHEGEWAEIRGSWERLR